MPILRKPPAGTARRFRPGIAVAITLGLLLPGSRADAQTRHRPSLDFTIGPATSWGGAHDYVGRLSTSWTLTFVPDNRGSRIVAFTLGGRHGPGNMGCPVMAYDDCAIFPDLTDLGIGVGLQGGEPKARARAILGPTLYLGDFRAGGVRLQLDGAGGWRHVQVVVAGRGDLVRRGAENLCLGSLEVGLRVID